MREHKGHDESNLKSNAVAESLQTIHLFLDSFSEEDFRQRCWELILYAFGSEDANGWSKHERSNMLFMYEQLIHVSKALVVIDREVTPLFITE